MQSSVVGVIFQVQKYFFCINNFADLIQSHLASGVLWENGIIDIVVKLQKANSLRHIALIGAHIGSVGIPLAEHFASISFFEPLKYNFDLLELNLKLNGICNAHTYNIALSDCKKSAKVVFNICNTGGTHVVSDEDVRGNVRHAQNYDEKQEVLCDALDNVNFASNPPDILIIDIEGHDTEFLSGARDFMQRNKPILLIELWTNEKRAFENMPMTQEDMIRKIQSFGYEHIKKLNNDTFLFFT